MMRKSGKSSAAAMSAMSGTMIASAERAIRVRNSPGAATSGAGTCVSLVAVIFTRPLERKKGRPDGGRSPTALGKSGHRADDTFDQEAHLLEPDVIGTILLA